jgi:hypothetical protein
MYVWLFCVTRALLVCRAGWQAPRDAQQHRSRYDSTATVCRSCLRPSQARTAWPSASVQRSLLCYLLCTLLFFDTVCVPCAHVPVPVPCARSGHSPDGNLSTPAIVARLQEDLALIVVKSRSVAPSLTPSLVESQQLVTEMVSRWRRSTTLALDSIKAFEDQLSRKNGEIDRLQKHIAQLVSTMHLAVSLRAGSGCAACGSTPV